MKMTRTIARSLAKDCYQFRLMTGRELTQKKIHFIDKPVEFERSTDPLTHDRLIWVKWQNTDGRIIHWPFKIAKSWAEL